MSEGFSIQESLREGWDKTREHFGFFLLALAVFIGVILGVAALQALLKVFGLGGSALGFVGNLVVSPLLGLGYHRAVLNAADGGKPRVADLFSQGPLLLNWWGVVLIWFGLLLALVAPLLLLAVVVAGISLFQLGPDTLQHPGILVALPLAFIAIMLLLLVRFGFVIWTLVDKGVGPVECFKRSAAISRGHGLNLVGFGLSLILLNFLGLLCLGLGLIVTIMISYNAMAHVYRQLDTQAT